MEEGTGGWRKLLSDGCPITFQAVLGGGRRIALPMLNLDA